MASSSSDSPQGVTFGVELEMLVPYLLSGQPDPAEGMDTRKVIRLSQEGMSYADRSSRPEDRVGSVLKEFLRSHGVPIWDSDLHGRADQALSPPTGWSLGSDNSVFEFKFISYRWVGMELRSPAFLANETSFAEVKRVVSLLRSSFRLRLNQTTGFHVHVGLGTQRLPPRALLRLVQLLWCADGTLSQLHPPERMLRSFAHPYGTIAFSLDVCWTTGKRPRTALMVAAWMSLL